jgi:tRNA nucleotidyltransferase/poly(A) polymerase
MFTIRAKFPSDHKFAKLDADFVMARKEVGYVEGTRRPILELGTLEDDLVRRDFTVNAMAEDEDGNLIDLFDGMWALENRMLLTPLDPAQTFLDDPLRMLRALRFSITKDFIIAPKVWSAMFIPTLIDKLQQVVSGERIREEIIKMMKVDTVATLRLLAEIDKIEPKFLEAVFSNGMWLKPTFEQ